MLPAGHALGQILVAINMMIRLPELIQTFRLSLDLQVHWLVATDRANARISQAT